VLVRVKRSSLLRLRINDLLDWVAPFLTQTSDNLLANAIKPFCPTCSKLVRLPLSATSTLVLNQGILTKGEGSVQLTSLFLSVKISCFPDWNFIFIFYKTTYLNEEVNCTEPSPSVGVPSLTFKVSLQEWSSLRLG
jgi:hypothetical protein